MGANILRILGQAAVATVSTILTKVFTERVIIRIMIRIMEYLVPKTTNQIDDRILTEVKEALKEYLE